MDQEAIEIRPYQPGDEDSIVEGWNAVFPAQDGLAERDLAYWRWQFEQNTLARTEVAVAIAGGRVVGQYAAVPQRALVEDAKGLVQALARVLHLLVYRGELALQ